MPHGAANKILKMSKRNKYGLCRMAAPLPPARGTVGYESSLLPPDGFPRLVDLPHWPHTCNRHRPIRGAPPHGSAGENLPALQEGQEMWVQSLDWEGPLEKKMATRSTVLVKIIPGTEEPGRLQSMGSQKVRHK